MLSVVMGQGLPVTFIHYPHNAFVPIGEWNPSMLGLIGWQVLHMNNLMCHHVRKTLFAFDGWNCFADEQLYVSSCWDTFKALIPLAVLCSAMSVTFTAMIQPMYYNSFLFQEDKKLRQQLKVQSLAPVQYGNNIHSATTLGYRCSTHIIFFWQGVTVIVFFTTSIFSPIFYQCLFTSSTEWFSLLHTCSFRWRNVFYDS